MSERITFKARDDWLRALAGAELSAMTRLIGMRLGLHLNCNTGRCDPSYAGLACEIGTSRSGAIRAIAALEASGWIEVDRHGGGRHRRNDFQLITPETVSPATPFSGPEKVSPARPFN